MIVSDQNWMAVVLAPTNPFLYTILVVNGFQA